MKWILTGQYSQGFTISAGQFRISTTEIAYRIGNSLAGYLKPKSIAVGRDMRISSEELFDALSEGIIDRGVDVVDLGMVSTDALYFAVGKYGYDGGVMITASHNPSRYNGFKVCRRNAEPLSGSEGLDIVCADLVADRVEKGSARGSIARRDISADFTDHVLSFIDPTVIKPFKICIDAWATAWEEISSRRVFRTVSPAISLLCFLNRTAPFPIIRPARLNRKIWSLCKRK